MSIEEIFKTNPALCQEREVQKLIEFVTESHKRLFYLYKNKIDFESKIIELVMHSEVILIEGIDSKTTLIEILNLIKNS